MLQRKQSDRHKTVFLCRQVDFQRSEAKKLSKPSLASGGPKKKLKVSTVCQNFIRNGLGRKATVKKLFLRNG